MGWLVCVAICLMLLACGVFLLWLSASMVWYCVCLFGLACLYVLAWLCWCVCVCVCAVVSVLRCLGFGCVGVCTVLNASWCW